MTDADKKSADNKNPELNSPAPESSDLDSPKLKPSDKKSDKKSSVSKDVKVKTKSTSSNAGPFIFTFFVAIATVGALYLLWEGQQTNSFKQQITSQNIDQQIDLLKKQQSESTTKNEEHIQKIHTEQENLRNNLTNIVRNNEHLRNDWLMAEAEYLVQVANHRLLLEKDVATASVALKAADARLAEVADPALLKIRKILAKDLQILNNIPTIDLAGLSVSLSAMSNDIPNLPLNTPDPKTHKLNTTEKTQASSEVKSIKDLPAAIWKDIKSLVVIRNHQKPLEP